MSARQSKACCTVPAVVSVDYQEKGSYETFAGLKTYRTGPAHAKKGLFVVYDIFGFFPQTTQGADILACASSEDVSEQRQVFMPDVLRGEYADLSWFPPDSKEKEKKLGDFFAGPGEPGKAVETVKETLKAIKEKYSEITEWGLLGYCWGGKVVNLLSSEKTLFKAAAAAHPAMVDAEDAKKIAIPIALLPSKGEDKDDVEKWQKEIKVPNKVEWFSDQEHGFMAARGDLNDEAVKKAYIKAYQVLIDWYHEHL